MLLCQRLRHLPLFQMEWVMSTNMLHLIQTTKDKKDNKDLPHQFHFASG